MRRRNLFIQYYGFKTGFRIKPDKLFTLLWLGLWNLSGCHLETYFARQFIPTVTVSVKYGKIQKISQRNAGENQNVKDNWQGHISCNWPMDSFESFDFVDIDEFETQRGREIFNVNQYDLWWNLEDIEDQGLSHSAQDLLISSSVKYAPIRKVDKAHFKSGCTWNELCVWEAKNIARTLEDWRMDDEK